MGGNGEDNTKLWVATEMKILNHGRETITGKENIQFWVEAARKTQNYERKRRKYSIMGGNSEEKFNHGREQRGKHENHGREWQEKYQVMSGNGAKRTQ